MRASEGRIQDAGVEPVFDGRAAAAALLFQGVAMTGATSGASALVHHAVISELHALRAKAQPRVHGPRAVGGFDPIAQCSPGDSEGAGQNGSMPFRVERDSLI